MTSASLAVAAPAAQAAASAARDLPALDVGLHLVVCKGVSVLGADKLAGIVDGQGRFVENPVLGGLKYFFNRRIRERLREECRAQIERHLAMVGYLNHIDGHLNFHAHPVLADLLVELAGEYRVPCLRLPREPVFTTLKLAREHMMRKLVEAAIFRSLSARMRRRMSARGLESTDWLFGLHQSGNLSENYLLAIIDRLRDGLTEIYFHPAADIGRTPPAAAAQREVEILTSMELRAALKARGVRLTTFAEFARAGRAPS